ncbi:unnamed protein product [Arctia plantaginis]|uniref:Uncharacterized protein n=1 Tax=Arctia plantaginis TaxID=874455 RepID=A0A8S1B874_ARCPL|nr:unnamed protein product [Arctia plantaginis]
MNPNKWFVFCLIRVLFIVPLKSLIAVGCAGADSVRSFRRQSSQARESSVRGSYRGPADASRHLKHGGHVRNMDVWSGRPPATCVRASPASPPLNVDTTTDNFALTFYESKDQPPPQPKQGVLYMSCSACSRTMR